MKRLIVLLLMGFLFANDVEKDNAISDLRHTIKSGKNNISFLNFSLHKKLSNHLDFLNQYNGEEIESAFTKLIVFEDTTANYVVIVTYGLPLNPSCWYYYFLKQKNKYVLEDILFAD